jgi:hypothetical protein
VAIRPKQLEALEYLAQTAFYERLATHLRGFCPEIFDEFSSPELTRFIAGAVAVARANGFTWQSSIASFVALMAVIGPNFHEAPRISAALRQMRSATEDRIAVLIRRLPAEAWDEALAADRQAAIRAFIKRRGP